MALGTVQRLDPREVFLIGFHAARTERADLGRESEELATGPEQEQAELTAIYVKRGLDPALASSVASHLMQHDALGAHARDELGISDILAARPIQAALASAGTFSVGAVLPLLIVLLFPAVASAQYYEVPPVPFTGILSHPRYELGGWFTAMQLLDMSSAEFVRGLRIFFEPFDVQYSMIKSASFGLVVSVVLGVLVARAGYPVPAVVLGLLAVVAAVDLVVIQRRRAARRREEPHARHSLYE